MLWFFILTSVLIAFTGGFLVACVLAVASNADARSVAEFARRQAALRRVR